jgi:putative transposase
VPARFGPPEALSTDQGSQFTSIAFTSAARREKIAIGMAGRGCWWDLLYVKRLRHSVKNEELCLRPCGSIS